ncbi:hypothetical protein CLF_101543 [Clonorchis sinensis]|uniref:Uncharacterized protein n=1 Tax=Clonorchis sinensis TaxID=79923 RepID=G7Y601_CLOSI|nr:hypothetical protein CLF_101543 [Clonorchis sinensis]
MHYPKNSIVKEVYQTRLHRRPLDTKRTSQPNKDLFKIRNALISAIDCARDTVIFEDEGEEPVLMTKLNTITACIFEVQSHASQPSFEPMNPSVYNMGNENTLPRQTTGLSSRTLKCSRLNAPYILTNDKTAFNNKTKFPIKGEATNAKTMYRKSSCALGWTCRFRTLSESDRVQLSNGNLAQSKAAYDIQAPLVHKLETYEIGGNILHRIRTLPSDRAFRAKGGLVYPSSALVSVGVSQSFILGPLLIYVKDLPDVHSRPYPLFEVTRKPRVPKPAPTNWLPKPHISGCCIDISLRICVHMSLRDQAKAFVDMAFAFSRRIGLIFFLIIRTDTQVLSGVHVRPLVQYANQIVYPGRKENSLIASNELL